MHTWTPTDANTNDWVTTWALQGHSPGELKCISTFYTYHAMENSADDKRIVLLFFLEKKIGSDALCKLSP